MLGFKCWRLWVSWAKNTLPQMGAKSIVRICTKSTVKSQVLSVMIIFGEYKKQIIYHALHYLPCSALFTAIRWKWHVCLDIIQHLCSHSKHQRYRHDKHCNRTHPGACRRHEELSKLWNNRGRSEFSSTFYTVGSK